MEQKQKSAGLFYSLFSLFLLPSLLVSSLSFLGDAKINFLYYVLNFLCMGVILFSYLREQLRFARQNISRVLAWAAAGGVAYFACNFLFSLGITLLFPNFSNQNDGSIAQQLSTDFYLVAAGTALLVPFAEELMHRAVIFGALYEKSPMAAYILSCLFFAAVHVVGYIGAAPAITLIISFIQYIPAGLILAWCYRKSGCIFTPMLLHAAINTLGILALR